jgi:hypothetical protein
MRKISRRVKKQTPHRFISEGGTPFSVPTPCGALTGHQDYSFYLRHKEVHEKRILNEFQKYNVREGFWIQVAPSEIQTLHVVNETELSNPCKEGNVSTN